MIHPSLPFFANGVGYLVGLVAAFFIIEPHIDTEKFSWVNFVKQNKQGLRELFKSPEIKRYTILLLSVGFVIVISWEMLDSFLAYEFGFTEIQLGILTSVLFLVSAGASQLTPRLRKKITGGTLIFVLGVGIAATFLISPVVGLAVGGISLFIRASLQSIFDNVTSVIINNNTESKYRATTLSTFNMIKNIPYVLSAYIIGSLADTYSARNLAFGLGVVLLVFLVVQMGMRRLRTVGELS